MVGGARREGISGERGGREPTDRAEESASIRLTIVLYPSICAFGPSCAAVATEHLAIPACHASRGNVPFSKISMANCHVLKIEKQP